MFIGAIIEGIDYQVIVRLQILRMKASQLGAEKGMGE
jgi:hypothetical protein